MIFLSQSTQQRLLKLVYAALQERGYNPAGQISGYILSGDPTYITNYNGARQMAAKLERESLLREILENFFSEC